MGYQPPLPESEVRPLQDEDEEHLAGEADKEGGEGGGGGHRRARGGRGRWAAARGRVWMPIDLRMCGRPRCVLWRAQPVVSSRR